MSSLDRNEKRRKSSPNDIAAHPGIMPQGDVLNFSVPTEIVPLPSEGKLYPPEHPLHGKDTIEIRHMTAKEEDILSSQSLIKRGQAVDRMLQNILIDNRIEINTLLVGDKNALMYAARITGYGANYPAYVNCSSCTERFEWDFDLSKYDECFTGPNEDEEGASYTGRGTIELELPVTKALLEIRALTGADEAFITKSAEMKRNQNLPETGLTDLLKLMIVSANGVTDRNLISNFVDLLPAADARHIRKVYKNFMPSISFIQETECHNCGYISKVEVPITGDFFWPG
tara:strand:+ start:698 stop:1555 length:858 start_codon:yes stop_codon:yes gene_type:complete